MHEVNAEGLGAAIIFTVLFLALGLGVAWLARHKLDLNHGGLMAGLVFAPIVGYLVFSGQIAELRGFGLAARFANASSAPVSVVAPRGESYREFVEKAEARRYFGIGSEVIFLKADWNSNGASTEKKVFTISQHIYSSLRTGTFVALVVIDDSASVLGYFPKSYFLEILRIEIEQTIRGDRKQYAKEEVMSALRQTLLWDIVEHPEERAMKWGESTTIGMGASNIEALETMQANKMNMAIVADQAGRYQGVVVKNDVVTDLLLKSYE